MRCGLFGKLPSKRDYVAVGAPRDFLETWEPWLQGGISASRHQLGGAWQDAFLQAPIWRFWLGADLCGTTVAGALMPSVDGVGRYFPLTVFAKADHDEAIPPPELVPNEAWFERAEDVLLSALAPDSSFEAIQEALAQLPGPGTRVQEPDAGMGLLPDRTLVGSAEPQALPGTLAAMRKVDHARVYAAMSVWWTVGGEGYAPLALLGRRMPSPYVFTGMLTGRFDGRHTGPIEVVR
jgi:type VI secretion system protein ImpM